MQEPRFHAFDFPWSVDGIHPLIIAATVKIFKPPLIKYYPIFIILLLLLYIWALVSRTNQILDHQCTSVKT